MGVLALAVSAGTAAAVQPRAAVTKSTAARVRKRVISQAFLVQKDRTGRERPDSGPRTTAGGEFLLRRSRATGLASPRGCWHYRCGSAPGSHRTSPAISLC